MKNSAIALPLALLAISLPASGAVDFIKDVQPILEASCVNCHRPDGAVTAAKSKLTLESRTSAFAAPTIVPGKPEESRLYTSTIAADDAHELMPPRNPATGKLLRLRPAETAILKAWIAEGAVWPEGVTLRAQKGNEVRYPDDNPDLVAALHERIVAHSKEAAEKDMQPYTTTIVNTAVKFDMVPIPGGVFKMGSPATETGRQPDEGPQREVGIAPFWMGKCEVSWDEYLLFMDHEEEANIRKAHRLTAEELAANHGADATAHPTRPYHEMSFGMGTDGFPAISMTQHAANKYCQWLSAKTGHFYRLPTEAEWEYAARAGTTTAYFWGDDAASLGDYCWWGKNSEFAYHKIGRKKPNPWGLYDILGNVCEWTLDQYDPAYYATVTAANPWNQATQPYPHSVRGGYYDSDQPAALRCAARAHSTPEWKSVDPQLPKSIWYHTSAPYIGFRIVRPLKTPTAAEMQAYWNNGVYRDDPKVFKPGE